MENVDTIRQQIYLGALLHDIGKFAFRSKLRKEGDNHEKLGQEFIREHLGKISILKTDIETIVDESKHHGTATYTRIADQINSSERNEENNKQWRRFLTSILSNINIGERLNNTGIYYYYPEHINQQNVIPVSDLSVKDTTHFVVDEKDSINKHYIEFEQFINELKKIQLIKDSNTLTTTIYFLLNKYLSRISSAGYLSTPDITLFDHSRATAGLVNCLTAQITQDKIKTYNPDNLKTDFILLKGDISGIQKFIYSDIDLNITGQGKGLAKRLRGRSFYINLITDLFADEFIKEFKLSEANILYSGGGHFNIVLPNFVDSKTKIEKITKEINLFLRRKISSRLNLIIGYTTCDRLLYTETNEILSKVSYELAKSKTKQNENDLEEIFFNNKVSPKFNEDDRIGRLIPYSEYLIEIEAKDGISFKDDKLLIAEFANFNKYYFVIKERNDENLKDYDLIFNFFKSRKDLIKNAKIIRLNDTNFLEHAENLLRDFKFPIAFTFKFIGQEAPKNKVGDILEFSELSELDFSSKTKKLSYPQLAILRLDVDNLGSIFGFGLGDKVSYSRIATLSRLMDQFFSGYFNSIAKKYQLYITYSGGDDAFIIGSWYNVVHFAKELYEQFKKFSCSNITFSAGIFICNENYPIAKMADKAAELEELSKNFANTEGKKKNAITVFDHTLNWEKYCKMLEFGEKLLAYTSEDGIKDKEKLARSLVHRLLRIIKSCLDRKGHVNTEILYRNVAQLHYLFARHGFTNDKIEKAQEGIAKDIITLLLSDFSKVNLIKDYLIPTNYVVLKTRKLNK